MNKCKWCGKRIENFVWYVGFGKDCYHNDKEAGLNCYKEYKKLIKSQETIGEEKEGRIK